MSAQGMPPNLLAFFAPRPPLEYIPPYSRYGFKPVYTGMGEYIKFFSSEPPLPPVHFETPKEKRERRKREKIEEHLRRQSQLIEEYDPHAIQNATTNAYATLFVARISYETVEKKLKKEFEVYGKIVQCKIVTDFNGKSRGYAFIEYEHESDLKKAYKQGDGKKIDGRRVIVDVERSRTVSNWIPRRLGGGKGPSRYTEPKNKNIRGNIAENVSASTYQNQNISSYNPRSSANWSKSNTFANTNSRLKTQNSNSRYGDSSNSYRRRSSYDTPYNEVKEPGSYYQGRPGYVEGNKLDHISKDSNRNHSNMPSRGYSNYDRSRRRNRSRDYFGQRHRSRSRESKH